VAIFQAMPKFWQVLLGHDKIFVHQHFGMNVCAMLLPAYAIGFGIRKCTLFSENIRDSAVVLAMLKLSRVHAFYSWRICLGCDDDDITIFKTFMG
jgi:hypothetical protein